MTYLDPAKEIQKRAEALASSINAALNAHYAKAKKAANQIAVSVSKAAAAAKVRTPEQQAALVLKGTSWTCNSAHMSDAGRHILVRIGGAPTWDLKSVAKNHPTAWAVLETRWNAGMVAQNLRNFAGNKSFNPWSSDPLHVELPDSRLPDTDPRVIRCLEVYAKATREEGKAKNKKYETTDGSLFQKTWLKNYDAKLAAKKGP